jgi:hypothetical protein
MIHSYQIARDDFILLRADQTVGEVITQLAHAEPSTVIVRRVCPDGTVYHYLYLELRQLLANASSNLSLEDALDLHEWQSTATVDAYSDAAKAPSSWVVTHGDAVIGFHDVTLRPQITRNDKTEGSGPRYLNAGLFRAQAAGTGKPLDSGRPLALDGGPYRMGVNVGQFWGPGAAGAPFPDELLAPHFEDQSALELEVVAHSLDVGIGVPHQTISLPKKGDSPLVFFDLTVAKAGRQAVDVDLLFHGHILQSRRLEAVVIAHAGDPLAPSDLPAQDGYITFTRTAALDWKSVGPIGAKPSGLTIVAERDLDYNRIGLRFYGAIGKELGFEQSTLTDASLGKAMSKVLEKHLGQLADIGRSFYLALMSDGQGQQLSVGIEPGTTIQVAPLSAQLGVPWEALYERKAESYREGRTKLCSTYSTHGPAPQDCPGAGDPSIVCPHGFWGYRYVIEQLPCRVDRNTSPPQSTLPLRVQNDLPLRFNGIVYAKFKQLTNHWDALRKMASAENLEMARFESLADVQSALTESGRTADIIYFYTHGGSDAFGKPYLEVGSGDQISYNDLDAWGVDLGNHRPLVMLNACDSADYSPDSFENLIRFFCGKKAAGVIGTQCEVKENLASAFSMLFFGAFFRQATAGEALFEARQALLRQLDPRGLAYSLFAAAEVKLNKPVIV